MQRTVRELLALTLLVGLAYGSTAWGFDQPVLRRRSNLVPPPPDSNDDDKPVSTTRLVQLPGESLPPGAKPEEPPVLPPSRQPREVAADEAIQPLGTLTINIKPNQEGRLPDDPARKFFKRAGTLYSVTGLDRPWAQVTYFWQSSSFYHRPLYFEETNLERNGFNIGLAQPALSAAHFFATIPALPYLATVYRPNEPIYTLGQYRPGSNVPFRCNWTPLQLDAAIVEGSFMTGMVFLIP